MPPEPGPKGGGEGRVSEFLFHAPGGIIGHAANVRAAHAEVSQVAFGQFVQFAQSLAIDRTAGHVITRIGQELGDPALAGLVADGALVQYENSHFINSSSCGFAAGRIACRFGRANLVLFLHLHNGDR